MERMRGKGLPRTLAKVAVIGLVAAVLPIAGAAGPAAAADVSARTYGSDPSGTSAPRSLGIPLTDVLLIGGTVGTMSDGRRVIWSASSGTPAILNAVDPTTGAPLLSVPLPGASGAYGVEQAADGSVYVGTYSDGKLFRLAPGATQAEDLGVPIPGELYVWAIVVAPDGTVYGGTSPGGKVFSWNPQTRAFHDYGVMADGDTYVKSIAYSNGKIYAGGYVSWEITELDPATGAKRALPLPPDVTNPTGKVVNDLRAYGGYLYAREGTPPGPLRVYDLTTGEWTNTVQNAAGLDVTPPGPDGRVWFFKQFEPGTSELIGYDPVTHAEQRTGLLAYGRIVNTRGIGWAQVNADGYPGQSIVGLFWRGLEFRYNPETGKSESIRTTISGQPTDVLALASGPPGTVYAGGFLQGGFANVSTKDGTATYQRFSQIESILPTSRGVVIGAYPDARVYRYDESQPWYSPEYSDEPPSGTANPVQLLNLHDHVQARLDAMTEVDSKLVTGSIPSGNTLGGTLAVLDSSSGATLQIHDQFVTDEGIMALTSDKHGIVYGTTTVAGGLSTTPPTQDQATVFAYDVAHDKKLWEAHPSATARSITAVQVDGLGRLWTVVDGDVYRLDPRTGKTLTVLDTSTTATAAAQLAVDGSGRTLYALVGGAHVVEVNTATEKWKPLFDQTALRMVYNDGDLVFASGAELIARRVG